MPNASQRQKMVDDLDRMLDSFEVQPLEEPPPETEPSSAEPDGEISAWIWLVAFVMCPVSALIGGAIVIEQTQELVVGVTAGIAGLIAGFVVAVLVCRIDAWKPPGTGDALRDFFEPYLAVGASLGGPAGTLAITMLVGSLVGG